jgi:phospholipase/lecithinase/hemolysin
MPSATANVVVLILPTNSWIESGYVRHETKFKITRRELRKVSLKQTGYRIIVHNSSRGTHFSLYRSATSLLNPSLMLHLRFLSLLLALFLLPSSYGRERLVVFGDSLSDIGNSFVASGGTAPPGQPLAPPGSPLRGDYGETFDGTGALFPGRFTDGENWVDYFPGFAEQFHADISRVTAWLQDPNSESATDFAVGGSTSGVLNVISRSLPSFPEQITAYLNGPGFKNAADDLCVIWIGSNDFGAKMNPLSTVANIKDAIAQLSFVGVKHFFVITIPDLALTPQVKAAGGATILAATQFVATTNVLLAVELPRFALTHQIGIDLVDINAIFVPVVYQPVRFGFTNSSKFAYEPPNGPLLVKDNPNNYVFWDGFHPTTKVHSLTAAFIFKNIFLSRALDPFLSLR